VLTIKYKRIGRSIFKKTNAGWRLDYSARSLGEAKSLVDMLKKINEGKITAKREP